MATLTKCDMCGKLEEYAGSWYRASNKDDLGYKLNVGDLCPECIKKLRAFIELHAEE